MCDSFESSVPGPSRTSRQLRNLELKAVEGRLVGYSNNSKSYLVYNPVTRRIMESRNVIFIETPSYLSPPSLEETSQ